MLIQLSNSPGTMLLRAISEMEILLQHENVTLAAPKRLGRDALFRSATLRLQHAR